MERRSIPPAAPTEFQPHGYRNDGGPGEDALFGDYQNGGGGGNDTLTGGDDNDSLAMDPGDDCFGEARLGKLVEQYGDLPADALRERVLAEIATFVNGAPQHDDMTMILLKVEAAGVDQASAPRSMPVAVRESMTAS